MKKAVPFLLLIILFAVAAWYSFIKQPDPVHELPPPEISLTEPVEVEPGQISGPWAKTSQEHCQ